MVPSALYWIDKYFEASLTLARFAVMHTLLGKERDWRFSDLANKCKIACIIGPPTGR